MIKKILKIGLAFLVLGGALISLPSVESIQAQKEFNDPQNLYPLQSTLTLVQENSISPICSPQTLQTREPQRIWVVVTAYSSTPHQTWGNPYLTASNTWVEEGMVANNLLPFGTRIRIPEIFGDKVFVVEDRMSWKKGYYHVDIWFPSFMEARDFGAKRTYIEVLEN